MSKLWVGSFFDRFGAHKIAVLSHQDATVQAAIKDCIVRRYIDTTERRDELIGLITYVASVTGLPLDPAVVVDSPATADELWYEGVAESVKPPPSIEDTQPPIEFVATHTVAGLGLAMLGEDGTVRFADGKWTTADALTAMGKTLEAI